MVWWWWSRAVVVVVIGRRAHRVLVMIGRLAHRVLVMGGDEWARRTPPFCDQTPMICFN